VQLLVHFLAVFILVVVALFVANKNVIKPLFNFLELDNETALPNKKSFKQIVCSKFLETETSGLLLIINLDYFNALTSSYSSIVVKQLLNQVKSRVENQIGVLGIFPSKVT
jgi:GGDEF domain-containing protein